MTTLLTGGCLCGAIRYTVSAEISELRACHCRHCQKASGAAGGVNAAIPSAALTITHGTPKCYAATAASGRVLNRYFCGDCGSPIYSRRAASPETSVLRAGTLDDDGDMRITTTIWTSSARRWAYIDPATRQFPGQP